LAAGCGLLILRRGGRVGFYILVFIADLLLVVTERAKFGNDLVVLVIRVEYKVAGELASGGIAVI